MKTRDKHSLNIKIIALPKKVEHIGIAVERIEEAKKVFDLILNKPAYKVEEVESEKVKTAFYTCGETKIELLESTDESGPIAGFLKKRGAGMHHIALEVDDIEATMRRLETAGIRLLNDKPKDGADNKRICFLHPKDTNGVLIELCQEKK